MKSKQTWLMVLAVGLLVAGCAGSSAQLSPQQFAAQLDSQDKPNRLQEQLLKQAPQLGIVDFKDYKVGPEDTLAVNFLDTDKLNTEVRVNGQGEISLLLVGTVPVADLTPHEVEKKLARLYKEGNYLRNPNITVTVKEYRYQKVAVTGAVNKPDYYSLIGPRTLLEVLGMAGGLSDKAGEVAHIIRANKKSPAGKPASPPQSFSQGTETIIVDLNRLLLKGEVGLNFSVKNGDVVYVPLARTAYVLGAVGKPGGVLIKDNMTVTKAIAQAGGQHLMLSSNDATILRLDENGQRQIIPVNIKQISKGAETDLPLKENDIVFVQESGFRRFLFDVKMLLPGSVSLAPAAMM